MMCSPGLRMNSWSFTPRWPHVSLQEDPYLTWILGDRGSYEDPHRVTRPSPGPNRAPATGKRHSLVPQLSPWAQEFGFLRQTGCSQSRALQPLGPVILGAVPSLPRPVCSSAKGE